MIFEDSEWNMFYVLKSRRRLPYCCQQPYRQLERFRGGSSKRIDFRSVFIKDSNKKIFIDSKIRKTYMVNDDEEI